jgi:SEC-C motif-containing protein
MPTRLPYGDAVNDMCPCGSGAAESACCAPIIAGAPAPTALALMRSRYTAYVRGAIDHIVATHDPKNRHEVDRDAAAKWSRETEWQGLTIRHTRAGGEADQEGEVEFVARGKTNGKPFEHGERSTFRKLDGRWYYVQSRSGGGEPVRAVAKAGRNDPCPCGSGKKYKRCHGA